MHSRGKLNFQILDAFHQRKIIPHIFHWCHCVNNSLIKLWIFSSSTASLLRTSLVEQRPNTKQIVQPLVPVNLCVGTCWYIYNYFRLAQKFTYSDHSGDIVGVGFFDHESVAEPEGESVGAEDA